MSRRPCIFKQRDVSKAVRAIVAAGVQIERVEVDRDGKIVIVTGKQLESLGRNEWDEVLDDADPPQVRK
jgi:hypothetical protein